MRAWAEAKARAKAEISRIAAEASERAKIESKVRSMERADAAESKTEESGA